MAERERETVVVEGDRRSPYGWVIALVVIALLLIIFFMTNGFGLFTMNSGGTETINVDTPDNVNVQPAP